MSATARHFTTLERPAPGRGSYALGFMVALGLHAAILFCLPKSHVPVEQIEFGVVADDSSVEVDLVAALPAEQPAEAVETPPEPPPPEPPPPEPPKPEPPPPVIMPDKPPEVTIPEPEPTPEPKPTPPPRQIQKPKPPKPVPPKPVARVSGDGSSAIPGNDATTAQRSMGGVSAKPSYLRNPHPTYPEEARKAGQQGTVTLAVKVDESGRPVAVRVVRSSGFPLLDERARSTVAGQWMFKPAKVGGVPIAQEVNIPVKFTLNN